MSKGTNISSRPLSQRKTKSRRSQTAATGAAANTLASSFLTGNAGRPDGLNATSARTAAGGALSTEELVRRSNFWRDNYNPLRSFTVGQLMALLEQAERGAFAEIQLTLRKAEKRFPVLKGFIEKMLSSVEQLDGRVRVKRQLPEGATPAMAERQRRFLQGRYDLLKNFKMAIAQIALADVRGYTVLQKHRYKDGVNDGAVEELYWIEPWCWARDGFYGDFYYNENSQFGVGLGSCQAVLGEDNRIGSEAMPRTEFVIREGESPLYEIALIAFANWIMGRRNHSAFVETFGLPSAVVILPENIPAGKEMEYQAAAESVARGISGAVPSGAEVKFPAATASVRAQNPFEEYCDVHEKDVVLAATSGHLTMLAMPTGIGQGPSEEHDDAWQKIAMAKAMRINETLQRHGFYQVFDYADPVSGNPMINMAIHGDGPNSSAGFYADYIECGTRLNSRGYFTSDGGNFFSDGSGNVTCLSLYQTSDINTKTNIVAVDTSAVLQKLLAVPVFRWNFRDYASTNFSTTNLVSRTNGTTISSTRTNATVIQHSVSGATHFGPMAQDWSARFGGRTNGISVVDMQGLLLAGMQALAQQNGMFTNANGAKFHLIVNSATNGFVFVPE